MADPPNYECGQYEGNELPCLRSVLFVCSWSKSAYHNILGRSYWSYTNSHDNIRDILLLSITSRLYLMHSPCEYLSRLRWAGHVVRMPDERLPKQLLYGELCAGKRSRGGQKKRFKDTLKVSLKRCGFDHNAWEELASDRPAWRSKVRSGVTEYEKERIQNAMEKRRQRKERAHKPPSPGQQLHLCPHCSQLFRAPIGLRSHLRTHLAWSHAHLHSWRRRKKTCHGSPCSWYWQYTNP